MMTKGPICIQDTNLSCAWARAFLEATQPTVQEISPLVVTITGFVDDKPTEDSAIRKVLDNALAKNRKQLCDTVANTIFPRSFWNPNQERAQLFERYRDVLPRLKWLSSLNRYGTYFERLIAFGPDKINQLDHIISTYHRGNHRRSALQASIFDPVADHTHQRRRGFPCMQHVTFAPDGQQGLAVTGFYAIQHLFERAYGNYLGLCYLGHFIAHELGLTLTKMTCIAGVARIGINKGDIKECLQKLEEITKGPLKC
jgi:thymidylate synthase